MPEFIIIVKSGYANICNLLSIKQLKNNMIMFVNKFKKIS